MKKITKTILGVFFLLTINSILAYLIRIFFSKNLSLESFGLFYSVLALLSLLNPLIDLGLNSSAVFFINKFLAKKEIEKYKLAILIQIIPQIISTLLLSAILFFSRYFLEHQYFKTQFSSEILTILIIYFIGNTILNITKNLLLSYQKNVLFYFLETIKYIVIFISAYILFDFNFEKVLIPAIAYSISLLVVIMLILTLFCKKIMNFFKTKIKFNKIVFREIKTYALSVVFLIIGNQFMRNTDTVILTIFNMIKEVGLYSAVAPIVLMISTFAQSFNMILYPKLTKLFHQDKIRDVTRIFNTLINNYLLILLPISLILFSYSSTIINLIFGNEYRGASKILMVFSIGFIFQFHKSFNFIFLASIGESSNRTKIQNVGIVLNIILNLILIPFFGAFGAAITTVLSFIYMSFASHVLLKKYFDIRIDIFTQIKVILASAGFLISINILKKIIKINLVANIFLVITISSLIFLIFLIVLRILTREKIRMFKNIFLG